MYGGEVHDMGIALLYFMPAFYCDTTDSVLFQQVAAALGEDGRPSTCEAIICTIATAAWAATYPDTLGTSCLQADALHGRLDGLLNINPLIRSTGSTPSRASWRSRSSRRESFRYLGALFSGTSSG